MRKSFGRAVIIGLGGTGQMALLRIKKMFLDYCGGKVPPCIKLLAFDTAPRESGRDGGGFVKFDDREFCHMRVLSIAESIKNPYAEPWWIPYPAINSLNVTAGTGGIREVGRLATFANVDKIESLLKESFDQIWRAHVKDEMEQLGMQLLEGEPMVFVICSFAGGTGSGSFFDFSLLCRELGGRSGHMFYSAFFVMPWIYRSLAKTSFENGYAALLELERLNTCSQESPYEVRYSPNRLVHLTECPYHIVNLVDGESRRGDRVLQHEQLPLFIADCIFNSVGAAGANYRQVVDNVRTMINLARTADWNGQQAIYSTFGTSAIVYPATEIHDWLSSRYAICLLERTLDFLGESPQAIEVQKKSVEPFLTQWSASTILNRILADNALRPFQVNEKTTNYRTGALLTAIENNRKAWEDGQKRMLNVKQNTQQLQTDVTQAAAKLLEDVKNFEATEQYPEGSYRKANQAILHHWQSVKEQLDDLLKQEEPKGADIEDLLNNSAKEITKRIPKRWTESTNPARIACGEYARHCTELLRWELRKDRISKAIDLCQLWAREANEREKEFKKISDKLELTRLRMRNQITYLSDRLSRYSVENLVKQKAIFEIYVGLEERIDKKTDMKINVYRIPGELSSILPSDWYLDPEESRQEDPEEVRAEDAEKYARIFEEFKNEEDLKNKEAFLNLSRDRLDTVFLEHARRKCDAVLRMSVIDVMRSMDEREHGATEKLIERALRYSSQLLPINENQLTGKQDVLTEFTVIGGDDSVRDYIEAHVPKPLPPEMPNIWVNTGERHRIAITNYFSVIPLYVLRGIENAREKYLGRIRPPAHTDRNFEFRLLDILPSSRNEIKVLKLLSLAMLKCTGPIIERLELPDDGRNYYRDSHYYYRRNPKIFKVVSDEDLMLPGTPGKFYSLYKELCEDFHADYREQLTNALLAVDTPDMKGRFLEEIADAYNRFKKILEDKDFNRMITGNLYRQQVTFFHNILRAEASITTALDRKFGLEARKAEPGKI